MTLQTYEEVKAFAPQRVLAEALGKVNGIDKLSPAVEKGTELHDRFVPGGNRFPGDEVGDDPQGLSGMVCQVFGGNFPPVIRTGKGE